MSKTGEKDWPVFPNVQYDVLRNQKNIHIYEAEPENFDFFLKTKTKQKQGLIKFNHLVI